MHFRELSSLTESEYVEKRKFRRNSGTESQRIGYLMSIEIFSVDKGHRKGKIIETLLMNSTKRTFDLVTPEVVKWNFLASSNPSTHSRYTVLSVTRHRQTWWKPRISSVIGSRNGKTVGRLDLSTCYRGSSSPAILFGSVRDMFYLFCTNLRRICISIPPFSIYIHPRV